MKIMCCGDSITDGFWYEGGYRLTLCRLLEENGYSDRVEFVGVNHSGNCYSNAHCGFSSFAIDDIPESVTGGRAGISSQLDRIFASCKPDITLLQIGTNDILSLYKLDQAGERLERLAMRIFEGMGGGVLYIALIPDMDAGDNTYIPREFFTPESMDKCVADYNDQVRATVERLCEKGYDARVADVHDVLNKSLLHDGVHPSEEGYRRMGEFWYGIISSELEGGTV